MAVATVKTTVITAVDGVSFHTLEQIAMLITIESTAMSTLVVCTLRSS